MTEEKSVGVKGVVAGWIKAGVTSVVALISGAFLMYLTPVINNTIKPAKPLANFATQANGLAVTFNNHSTGGTEGWWDFGDGSALEPFSNKITTLTHAYDRPGTYNVKLTLQNLIGEESDRTVPINLDAAKAMTPEFELFDLQPVTKSERAPATYCLKSKVKNATMCILAVGDDRPLQLDFDTANQVRYVTFEDMGAYTVRLAAINGKDIVEKIQTVYISPNEGRDLLARLSTSYDAVKVERLNRTYHVPCSWQRDPKESVSPFRAERLVPQGFTIQSLEIVNKEEKNAPVRNVSWELSPEKNRFSVTGELMKSKSWLSPKTVPSWNAEVHVVLERRSAPVLLNRGDVTMAVSMNNTIKLPIQPLEEGWLVRRKQTSLELLDGTKKVWETSQAVSNAKVQLKNQSCLVSVVPQTDGMLLKIDTTSGAPGPMVSPLTSPYAPNLTIKPASQPISPITAVTPVVVRPTSMERLPFLPRPKGN